MDALVRVVLESILQNLTAKFASPSEPSKTRRFRVHSMYRIDRNASVDGLLVLEVQNRILDNWA